MDYIDLDDNEFDNFLRSKAKRKRARRALLSGGLSEVGRNKRVRRAVLTGGASELGRAARANPRIAKALLTGGLSERKAIRKLRHKCKKMLATARFASRRDKKRAMKNCLGEAIAFHKEAARTGLYGGTMGQVVKKMRAYDRPTTGITRAMARARALGR